MGPGCNVVKSITYLLTRYNVPLPAGSTSAEEERNRILEDERLRKEAEARQLREEEERRRREEEVHRLAQEALERGP